MSVLMVMPGRLGFVLVRRNPSLLGDGTDLLGEVFLNGAIGPFRFDRDLEFHLPGLAPDICLVMGIPVFTMRFSSVIAKFLPH